MDGLSDPGFGALGVSVRGKISPQPVVLGSLEEVRPRTARQQTLASSIGCRGVGLHAGREVRLDLHPALPGSGIGFTRIDLPGSLPGQRDGVPIAARHDSVVDSRLCTILGNVDGDTTIATIEHLMAALAGSGIDNALVTVDGGEIPILDGSADPFLSLIDCAGTVEQAAPRQVIEVLRPVRVTHGAAWAELRPAAGRPGPDCAGLDMSLSIDFEAEAIGRQSFALSLSPASFRRELAPARTFTQAGEIAELHAAGLALGGSLQNAVVVDGATILNPGGLRLPQEFVRHKLLDAVGDLALAGHALQARFAAHRTGHALNNRLLHALFADRLAWRLTAPADRTWLSAA